jgi:uncharacterized protein YciI
MHYVLIYEFTDDYLTRREEFRTEHLRFVWEAVDRGEVLLGGALGDPPSGGIIIFTVPDASLVETFAADDPYAAAGLIRRWRVTPWATVVGLGATDPMRPA